MQLVTMIAGLVLWIALGTAVSAVALGFMLNMLDRLVGRFERLTRADERRQVGNTLVTHSWWFSKDKVTMDLLAVAGRDLMRGVEPLSDISVERERWREARRKAVFVPAQERR